MDTHDRAREVLANAFDEAGATNVAKGIRESESCLISSRIAITAMLAFATTPATDQPQPAGVAIPEGMVAWGQKHPDYPDTPSDWDPLGPVMLACDELLEPDADPLDWTHCGGEGGCLEGWCIVAYTPKPVDAQPAGVPDMVLVPREPTRTMVLNALAPGGHAYPMRLSEDDVKACWDAMVVAVLVNAPAQPVASDQRAEVEAVTGEQLFRAFMAGDTNRLTTTALPSEWEGLAPSYRAAWNDLAAALAPTSHDAAMGEG